MLHLLTMEFMTCNAASHHLGIQHFGLTLMVLSHHCAVVSVCIWESAACTVSSIWTFNNWPLSKRSVPGRGSVTVFTIFLVVLFGGSWYFSLVLFNPYTLPVTSIKKPWPATDSRPENALFKLGPLDRNSGLEKPSFVVGSGLFKNASPVFSKTHHIF